MVERVSQEMQIAALVSGLCQNLSQRGPETGVIVGDKQFDAMEAARLEGLDENRRHTLYRRLGQKPEGTAEVEAGHAPTGRAGRCRSTDFIDRLTIEPI